MPSPTQYDTVKQQCNSFKEKGYLVSFEMQGVIHDAAPKVLLIKDDRSWRFCDPDWDVVIRQLSRLYETRRVLTH